MKEARWNLFGHVLRLPNDSPAQLAMDFYFEKPRDKERYKGQCRTTLPVVLNKDIIEANKHTKLPTTQFITNGDLFNLRQLANDKNKWKEIVKKICGIV